MENTVPSPSSLLRKVGEKVWPHVYGSEIFDTYTGKSLTVVPSKDTHPSSTSTNSTLEETTNSGTDETVVPPARINRVWHGDKHVLCTFTTHNDTDTVPLSSYHTLALPCSSSSASASPSSPPGERLTDHQRQQLFTLLRIPSSSFPPSSSSSPSPDPVSSSSSVSSLFPSSFFVYHHTSPLIYTEYITIPLYKETTNPQNSTTSNSNHATTNDDTNEVMVPSVPLPPLKTYLGNIRSYLFLHSDGTVTLWAYQPDILTFTTKSHEKYTNNTEKRNNNNTGKESKKSTATNSSSALSSSSSAATVHFPTEKEQGSYMFMESFSCVDFLPPSVTFTMESGIYNRNDNSLLFSVRHVTKETGKTVNENTNRATTTSSTLTSTLDGNQHWIVALPFRYILPYMGKNSNGNRNNSSSMIDIEIEPSIILYSWFDINSSFQTTDAVSASTSSSSSIFAVPTKPVFIPRPIMNPQDDKDTKDTMIPDNSASLSYLYYIFHPQYLLCIRPSTVSTGNQDRNTAGMTTTTSTTTLAPFTSVPLQPTFEYYKTCNLWSPLSVTSSNEATADLPVVLDTLVHPLTKEILLVTNTGVVYRVKENTNPNGKSTIQYQPLSELQCFTKLCTGFVSTSSSSYGTLQTYSYVHGPVLVFILSSTNTDNDAFTLGLVYDIVTGILLQALPHILPVPNSVSSSSRSLSLWSNILTKGSDGNHTVGGIFTDSILYQFSLPSINEYIHSLVTGLENLPFDTNATVNTSTTIDTVKVWRKLTSYGLASILTKLFQSSSPSSLPPFRNSNPSFVTVSANKEATIMVQSLSTLSSLSPSYVTDILRWVCDASACGIPSTLPLLKSLLIPSVPSSSFSAPLVSSSSLSLNDFTFATGIRTLANQFNSLLSLLPGLIVYLPFDNPNVQYTFSTISSSAAGNGTRYGILTRLLFILRVLGFKKYQIENAVGLRIDSAGNFLNRTIVSHPHTNSNGYRNDKHATLSAPSNFSPSLHLPPDAYYYQSVITNKDIDENEARTGSTGTFLHTPSKHTLSTEKSSSAIHGLGREQSLSSGLDADTLVDPSVSSTGIRRRVSSMSHRKEMDDDQYEAQFWDTEINDENSEEYAPVSTLPVYRTLVSSILRYIRLHCYLNILIGDNFIHDTSSGILINKADISDISGGTSSSQSALLINSTNPYPSNPSKTVSPIENRTQAAIAVLQSAVGPTTENVGSTVAFLDVLSECTRILLSSSLLDLQNIPTTELPVYWRIYQAKLRSLMAQILAASSSSPLLTLSTLPPPTVPWDFSASLPKLLHAERTIPSVPSLNLSHGRSTSGSSLDHPSSSSTMFELDQSIEFEMTIRLLYTLAPSQVFSLVSTIHHAAPLAWKGTVPEALKSALRLEAQYINNRSIGGSLRTSNDSNSASYSLFLRAYLSLPPITRITADSKKDWSPVGEFLQGYHAIQPSPYTNNYGNRHRSASVSGRKQRFGSIPTNGTASPNTSRHRSSSIIDITVNNRNSRTNSNAEYPIHSVNSETATQKSSLSTTVPHQLSNTAIREALFAKGSSPSNNSNANSPRPRTDTEPMSTLPSHLLAHIDLLKRLHRSTDALRLLLEHNYWYEALQLLTEIETDDGYSYGSGSNINDTVNTLMTNKMSNSNNDTSTDSNPVDTLFVRLLQYPIVQNSLQDAYGAKLNTGSTSNTNHKNDSGNTGAPSFVTLMQQGFFKLPTLVRLHDRTDIWSYLPRLCGLYGNLPYSSTEGATTIPNNPTPTNLLPLPELLTKDEEKTITTMITNGRSNDYTVNGGGNKEQSNPSSFFFSPTTFSTTAGIVKYSGTTNQRTVHWSILFRTALVKGRTDILLLLWKRIPSSLSSNLPALLRIIEMCVEEDKEKKENGKNGIVLSTVPAWSILPFCVLLAKQYAHDMEDTNRKMRREATARAAEGIATMGSVLRAWKR